MCVFKYDLFTILNLKYVILELQQYAMKFIEFIACLAIRF